MALKGTPVQSKADQFAAEWWAVFAKQPSQLYTQFSNLEVTVVSAKEVAIGEFGRRLLDRAAYAAVHADKSAARTGVNDEKSDFKGNPCWGEAVQVTVQPGEAAIYVEIYCQKRDGPQEPVAAARVPVGDFYVLPPCELHCLSYWLFDTGPATGSRNGIVNITVKRLDGARAATVPPGKGKGGRGVEDAASGASVKEEAKMPAA